MGLVCEKAMGTHVLEGLPSPGFLAGTRFTIFPFTPWPLVKTALEDPQPSVPLSSPLIRAQAAANPLQPRKPLPRCPR